MTLTLPYPPSSNRYWRVWRGRAVKSTEAREYQKTVGILARRCGLKRLGGPCSVFFHVYRPRRRGDLDNALKVILDALKGIAYLDDGQIEEIYALRSDDKLSPRVELFIKGLAP